MTAEEFGRYLKGLREKRSLTIRQVEIQAGISNSYLSLVENGKRGIPKPKILKKLSLIYKESYEEILKAANIIDSETESEPITHSPLEKFINCFETLSEEDRKEAIKILINRALESDKK